MNRNLGCWEPELNRIEKRETPIDAAMLPKLRPSSEHEDAEAFVLDYMAADDFDQVADDSWTTGEVVDLLARYIRTAANAEVRGSER